MKRTRARGRFAARTKVPVAQSQNEIQQLVERYGASHFGVMSDPRCQMIAFRVSNLNVRFTIPKAEPAGDSEAAARAAEKELRRLWRALVLSIKAKLEMIESGLACFEEEFLAHVVTPTGRTIGEEIIPQIESIQQGSTLPLLPAPKEA